MPIVSAGIPQVFSWTQEDSGHVHQFAEREERNQEAHGKEMDIKEQVHSLWRHGSETGHCHDPFLNLYQIDLIDEPHENTRDDDSRNSKKHKVVRGKRNISDLWVDDASEEEIGQCGQKDDIADVDDRQKALKN